MTDITNVRTERTARVQDLINDWFPPSQHPYRVLERCLDDDLTPADRVLELGCGRNAPLLSRLKDRVQHLVGVDLVEFAANDPDLTLVRGDIADMASIDDSSIDLAFSRSVMEHVENIDGCYREILRVLKPGGRYLFLTPNFHDYASILSHLIPNRFHQGIVRATEGRDALDTFPTFYRSNTHRSIKQLAEGHGLTVERFDYLGQYPAYFTFNRPLFILGARYEQFLQRYSCLHWLRGWILCSLRKPKEAV